MYPDPGLIIEKEILFSGQDILDNTDLDRRRILGAATSLAASAGLVGISIPLVKSWQPSAKAKMSGAPVEVAVGNIESGAMITVKWRSKPIWILKRTESSLKNLLNPVHLNKLRDPELIVNNQPVYAKNEYRSIRPDVFVAVGICTHLGCVPTYVSSGANSSDSAIYFCPCHGSKFDLAGRVFKGVPAPTNLIIPPHQYIEDDIIKIGGDDGQ